MRKAIPIIALATIISIALWRHAQSGAAGQNGATEAEKDIGAGRLRVMRYGHIEGIWEEHYANLLKERFGVDLVSVGTCEVSNERIEYARDYNRRMEEHLIGLFGADALDKAYQDAREMAAKWAAKE